MYPTADSDCATNYIHYARMENMRIMQKAFINSYMYVPCNFNKYSVFQKNSTRYKFAKPMRREYALYVAQERY